MQKGHASSMKFRSPGQMVGAFKSPRSSGGGGGGGGRCRIWLRFNSTLVPSACHFNVNLPSSCTWSTIAWYHKPSLQRPSTFSPNLKVVGGVDTSFSTEAPAFSDSGRTTALV